MAHDPSSPVATTGQLIANRYRLYHSLGKGTFGEVFYAEDIKFKPPKGVAIKILHPNYLHMPRVRKELEKEASTLARFSHPNILRVIDFEVSEKQAYIVTELAEGGSLDAKLHPD